MNKNRKLTTLISLWIVAAMLLSSVAQALAMPLRFTESQPAVHPLSGTPFAEPTFSSAPLAAAGSPDNVSAQPDQAAPQERQPAPLTGHVLFAPAIDLDDDPATNPTAMQRVPVADLLGDLVSIVVLAAQLEPEDQDKIAIGVPVTFRIWNEEGVQFEHTARSDAWGAASVRAPLADLKGEYQYQASAPGYGETEVRWFRFDAGQVSQVLRTDGAPLTAQEQESGPTRLTLHSATPLEAGRDQATLFILRRPQMDSPGAAVESPLQPIFEAIGEAGLGLPFPTVAMKIVDTHTAMIEAQLPAGDYGLLGLLTINGAPAERIYSQPLRLTIDQQARRPAGEAAWVSGLEYEPGRVLVQYSASQGQAIFDLVSLDEIPEVVEAWEEKTEFVKRVRTGPFEWEEERYDVTLETLVDDGKKLVTLEDFDYDPISRRYTLAIKSLQDQVITDTLRVDVLGPGGIVIHHEDAQVVLHPNRILHYSLEVPASVGRPHGLRVVLDDPFEGIIQSLETAGRFLYRTLESLNTSPAPGIQGSSGSFNFTLSLYVEVLGYTLAEYSFSFPPGTSSSFTMSPSGLGAELVKEVLKWLWATAFGATGPYSLGSLGLDASLDFSATFTVEEGDCPDSSAIPAIKTSLQNLANSLDSQMQSLKIGPKTINTPPINLVWVIAVWGNATGSLSGSVSASGLSLQVSANGSLNAALNAGLALPGGGGGPSDSFNFATSIIGMAIVVKVASTVADWTVPQDDCDPDPPDPKPPDERQDVWQGIENFYEGNSDDETIDNLSKLIQRTQSQGLWRAERLLTVRLREVELFRFSTNMVGLDEYVTGMTNILSEAGNDLRSIISGTVPISPSVPITEAVTTRMEQVADDLEGLTYEQKQRELLDALAVADRLYLQLRGQELELQRELRQLLTDGVVGVVASGFAEATLSALDAAGLPAQLISPWPSSGEFRGHPAPYLAPELAPRAMVVPSGGLHAIAGSPGARDWLEDYTTSGGLLVVFTQPFGSDWEALPGGQVGGVGYEEDRRWQHATVEAAVPSPWLAWMGIEKPDIQIDGAFTAWPSNATILLRRTFGDYAGYPVMIEYPLGEGLVFATPAYGDWAWQAGFWWGDDWQMTRSVLSRAYLIATGQDIGAAFPAEPASTVTVTFPISNTSAFPLESVEVLLPSRLGYWGKDYSDVALLALAPGESGLVEATFSTPPVRRGVHDWTQVGIYRLRVIAKTVNGDTYEIPGPFINVLSPVIPPALASAIVVENTSASLFERIPVTATVKNFTEVTRTVTITSLGDLPRSRVSLDVPPRDTAAHVYTLFMDRSKNAVVEVYNEEGNLIGRPNMSVEVAYPQLEAELLVPETLSDGSTIRVVVTNFARQAQAISGTVSVTLTAPSGAVVWTDENMLPPIAAGGQVTTTFTFVGTVDELGVYKLRHRVDDGRSLSRTYFASIASKLSMDTAIDRAYYRIRESGLLTVTLRNPGRFDLAPRLTVSAPDLGLSDVQDLNVPVNGTEVLVYALNLPASLPSGPHPVDVTYAVGDYTATQTQVVAVPPARLRAFLEVSEYAAGDTVSVTLANPGGVDAPVTAALQLRDDHNVAIAEGPDATTVPAGGSSALGLAIPAGAAQGEYSIAMRGRNTDTDMPIVSYQGLTVNGVAGSLAVQTDDPDYFNDEPVQVLADFDITAGSLDNGEMTLRICAPVGQPSGPPPPEFVRKSPAFRSAWQAPDSWIGLQSLLDAPPATLLAEEAFSHQPAPLMSRERRPKRRIIPGQPSDQVFASPEVVDFTAISGFPLQINVATDASYQVMYDPENFVPPGQVYPPDVDLGDSGLFLWYDGYAIGPNFIEHPDTGANDYDPWTGVSQSRVTGQGSESDPWVVETEVVHEDSGATMTTWTSYVNGSNFFRMDWQVCLPQPAIVSSFLAADYYLEGSDWGYGFYDPDSGSIGGYNETQDWFEIFTPIRPAAHFLESDYWEVWDAIGWPGDPGPGFSDAYSTELIDDGGGLQWDLTVSGCSMLSAFWSFGETPIIPSPAPPAEPGCGYVLWETALPVSTSDAFPFSEVIGSLDTTGRLILQGWVDANTGQRLTYAEYPFYVQDRNTGLTLETDKPIYRPGQTVQVGGVVTNTSGLQQTMTLVVSANGATRIEQPLTLEPGEAYVYATTTSATDPLTLTASASNALVVLNPIVADPQGTAALVAPDVVGRAPFSATLLITNTGVVTALVDTTLVGRPGPTFTLQPGQVAAVEETVQVFADAVLTGTVSGDLAILLSHPVIQGELAELELSPPDTDLAGLIDVPDLIRGVGLLPASGQLKLELAGKPVLQQPFAVLVGEEAADTLPIMAAAGRHMLVGKLVDDYGNLMDQDELELVLVTPAKAETPDVRLVSVTAAPSPVAAGSVVSVTVEVANEGPTGPVIIGLQLFEPLAQQVITPTGFLTTSFIFPMVVPPDVPIDTYFGEVVLEDETGPFAVDVVGIDIEMVIALDREFYFPNDVAELTVTLTDKAGITEDYIIMSRYLSAEGYYTTTVPAYETIQYTFPFTVTDPGRVTVFLSYVPSPEFGQRVITLDSLPVQVIIPYKGAYMTFDKLVYDASETIHMTVTVSGTLGTVIAMGPMELALRDAGFIFWEAPQSEDRLRLVIPGSYPLTYTLPLVVREGRYTFLLQADGQTIEYPVDVRGWKVTTRHISLDRSRYAPEDHLSAVVEFWNEGNITIEDLQLTAWIYTPDESEILELIPPITQTLDLQPGLNVVKFSGDFITPAVGPHRLLVNLGLPGAFGRLAGAVAQFDVGWAHLVELTTDRGSYDPGQPGNGRVDIYGFGPTQLTVRSSTGATLLDKRPDLEGARSFSFPIPTDEIGDYLLVAESTDQNGYGDDLLRAYNVPAPLDDRPPTITLTYPLKTVIIATSAPTTTITVIGWAADDSGQVAVLVNGRPAAVAPSGDFSLPLEVRKGVNLISTVASDPSDNITFGPKATVIVVPTHGVGLHVEPDEVSAGDPVTYTAVLTASDAIDKVSLFDLLPSGSITNPVGWADSGKVKVNRQAGEWSGAVSGGEPLTVTIRVSPLEPGILTSTVSAFWGFGTVDKSNEVVVQVNEVNNVPVANADSAFCKRRQHVIVDVLDNDFDADDDPLYVVEVTQGAHGQVENLGLRVLYRPDRRFLGVDSFTYTVSDGNGATATATVTVTVR